MDRLAESVLIAVTDYHGEVSGKPKRLLKERGLDGTRTYLLEMDGIPDSDSYFQQIGRHVIGFPTDMYKKPVADQNEALKKGPITMEDWNRYFNKVDIIPPTVMRGVEIIQREVPKNG